MGLALDSQGNVFVAEIGNHAIRSISSSGIVDTIISERSALHSEFKSPIGIAIDKKDTLFITLDSLCEVFTLTRVQPDGQTPGIATWVIGRITICTDIAGVPRMQSSRFSGIALDKYGNFYLSVVKGSVIQASGNGTGRILPLWLDSAAGIAVRENELFVSEKLRHCIHRLVFDTRWSVARHARFPKQFRHLVRLLVTLRSCTSVVSLLQKLPKEILFYTISFMSISSP
jgi:hypothetical protein